MRCHSGSNEQYARCLPYQTCPHVKYLELAAGRLVCAAAAGVTEPLLSEMLGTLQLVSSFCLIILGTCVKILEADVSGSGP